MSDPLAFTLAVLHEDAVDPRRSADWRYGVRHALALVERALAAPPPEAGLRAAAQAVLNELDIIREHRDKTGVGYLVVHPDAHAALRAALASPADPLSEPVEYTPGGLRYPTLDELNGGTVRTDLPMLRPADPDMEERLREDLRAIEESRPPGSYPHLGSETDIARLAARLAQGWRR